MARRNLLLLLAVVILSAFPLLLPNRGLFEGADVKAQALIGELRPDYEPWASPLFMPPSGEVESLLFVLQAAIGAGFIGYYFGMVRGRRMSTKPEAR